MAESVTDKCRSAGAPLAFGGRIVEKSCNAINDVVAPRIKAAFEFTARRICTSAVGSRKARLVSSESQRQYASASSKLTSTVGWLPWPGGGLSASHT
jgi:hypothetical protein